MDAMTAGETWSALAKCQYADFDKRTTVKVWALMSASDAKHYAIDTRAAEYGNVWALVEASSISRSHYGIGITLWRSAASSWHPYGNALLPR